VVVILVRLISMLACSYGGYRVALLLNDNYILKDPQQVLAIVTGIVLGVLIGYVLGGILGRYVANLAGRLESTVFRASGADVFLVMAGVFVGFLLALMPSVALLGFGYPGFIISLALFVLLGFLGGRVAHVKRSELSAIFKLSGALGQEASGPGPRLLDTSVIIDGRIVDIAKSGFIDGTLVVPRFVLEELQSIADSADALRRNRGRRGLDILNALQRLDRVNVEITDQDFPDLSGVDTKLTALSKATNMPLVTNDFNLNRIAEIQGVRILNMNLLASALKPVVLPGEEMEIKVIREGKEPGQGVGYLDDGTMVVIENGREKIGSEVTVVATGVLQTPAGKMVFTELKDTRQEA
jgi:uncharacterized protein YacL